MANQATAQFQIPFASDGSSTTATFDLSTCLIVWFPAQTTFSTPNAREASGADSLTVATSGGQNNQTATVTSFTRGVLTLSFPTALPTGASVCNGRLLF